MQALKTLQGEIGGDAEYEGDLFLKGLYDGLELALAMLENRDPNCRVHGVN
jgi:hypothetical protein